MSLTGNRKRRPVSDTDIKAIIRAEITASDGQANSALSVERSQNMDYYQGRPFGNEVDDRSSVVMSTVADTIEWILPTIVRIFCSGEDAVEFEPETENDVKTAKQATEYVNFIWDRDNKGFLNFYSWFKDALLQKNGVIKIWWDNTPTHKRERYYGLDDFSFTQIASDPDVEVSEHTENKETVETVAPDPKTGELTPQTKNITTHDMVITRTNKKGRVCVVPVPPEEFLISKDARDIENAKFVGHRRRRTVSDLIEEGFDKAQVEALSGDETSIQTDSEEIARNTVEYVVPLGEAAINPAMRQLWVTEGYVRVDVDGDGIAEMRKVVVAGPGYDILKNEAWDTPRPFANLTPIIMPHRYHGLCPADLVKDIQLIQSTILRQYLDNLYLANNQREQVIEANIVDPQEVLSSAPGRKIRIKNGQAVFPIEVPNVGEQALAGMAYIDQLLENRTGVSARTQGLGANDLHETLGGERMLMSAAMGKIELIARIFAETGVKDAFRLILKLICEYQDQPRTIKLNEEWVSMDPRSWNSDMDMTVRVGMGMGDKDQQMQHAMALGQAQAQALPLGVISPENLKNTAEILVNAMGFKGVERFFTFPQGAAGQQPIQLPPAHQKPGTDPQTLMQLENIKNQGKVQVATITSQTKAQTEAGKAQAKAATDANLNQVELQRHAIEQRGQMQLEAFKSKMDGMIELAVAHIKAAAQIEAARVAASASDGADAEARESAGEAA
jgi:hypothetical protein